MPVKNIALTLPLNCLEYRLAQYLRKVKQIFERRIRMKEKKKAEKEMCGSFPTGEDKEEKEGKKNPELIQI